jgi:hypothetical protein
MKQVKARVHPDADQPKMNGLESRYARHLGLLKLEGKVSAFQYESIAFRLADRTTYNPDFLVILPDGSVEIHETKGFMRDDAAVKIKVAARMFPWFTFRLVRQQGGLWQITQIPS